VGNRAVVALAKRCRRLARLFSVLVGGASVLAATEATVDQLIQQVESRYNHAQTVSLGFRENYSILGHARPGEAGTLTLRKQGKMRWDYTQPAGKLFISDGKSVFLYTAKDNRVEKIPLRDTEDIRAPLAFLLGHLDLKKEFRDFEMHAGERGTWLEGAAKSDRAPYERIAMLVAADGSVEQLKVIGRDGSNLEFHFTNERINNPVNDELFHFTIPAGAQVVDSVGLAASER